MQRRFSKAMAFAVGLAAIVIDASPARAEPRDAEALALAKEAIESDYLATRFQDAEGKLLRAIELCANDACSPAVRAQLHRDLGVVYLGGMSRAEDAKGQFAAALKLDPVVALNPDLASEEIQAAFDEVKAGGSAEAALAPAEPPPGQADPAAAPPIPPPGPVSAKDCPPDFPGCTGSTPERRPCEVDGSCPDEAANGAPENWVSAGVQQDFLIIPGATNTCSGGTGYDCFREDGSFYNRVPYDRSGGELRGGIAVATTRILAGYDRAIGSLTLGARVGWALGGGPEAPGGRSFVPVHAEGRLSYWFGDDPFKRAGLRPFVMIGGGVTQVDSRTTVIVYETESDAIADRRLELEAWKKTGLAFVSAGAGAMLAIAPGHGPVAEIRFMQLFGAGGSALGAQLGYALGF